MIKYLDLTETERDHEQQAWLESMEKNTFICAGKACIDRCHKGFTEEEIQKFPEYNTMPPPTEEHAKWTLNAELHLS